MSMDALEFPLPSLRPVHRFGARMHVSAAACAMLALALLCWSRLAPAQSDIYVCAGPNGVPEYRNGNGGKGCKRLSLPEVTTVPGGRVSAPAAGKGAGPAAAFPRVDGATQKSRD